MTANRTATSSVAVTEASDRAEEALLGSLIIEDSRAILLKVSQVVKVSDFRGYLPGESMRIQPINVRIFSAMQACESPNEVMIAQEMTRRGWLEKGDCAHLVHLVAEVPSSLDWPAFAEAVAYYGSRRMGRIPSPQRRVYGGLHVET